jgi:hypothetical protein
MQAIQGRPSDDPSLGIRDLDDAERLTLAQKRVCSHRLEGDVNHLVGIEMAWQVLHNLRSRLDKQARDSLHMILVRGLTHEFHLYVNDTVLLVVADT